MTKLDEFRAQHGHAYDDMSDSQLADALYRKHYSDMPRDQFDAKMGLTSPIAQAQSEMSQMTQHPGQAIAEQTRQRDVADYAALPAWKRPVVDTLDLVNTSGRAAAGLVTGAVNLGSKALAATGAGTPVISMTPEEVMARFRSGQSSGPAFDAEVEKQKRQTEASRNRLQWAAPIAEAAPLAMVPIAKVAKGLPLLNTMLTGAGVGAATAAGNKEDALLGAAGGAAGAAGGHVIGQGLGWALNKGLGVAGKVADYVAPSLATKTGLHIQPPTPTMSADEIKTLAGHAFDEASSHGIIFNKAGITDLQKKIYADQTKRVYMPENEPGMVAFNRKLEEYVTQGNVTFEGLQGLRRLAQNGWRFQNASNNALVGKAISRIDDLVNKMDPAHMAATTTNPKAAAEAARYARMMWHRGSKVEDVEQLIERARRQGQTNVTQNTPQLIQKQLVKINDPTRSVGRGFTAAEKKAADEAATRTGQQAFWHDLSGMMPRGKLMTAVHAAPLLAAAATGGLTLPGALAAGGLLATKMAVGHVAEKQVAKLVDRSVEDLIHLISTGGMPRRTAQSVLQRLAQSKRAAVLKGLGRAGMGFGGAAANQLYRAYGQNEAAHP